MKRTLLLLTLFLAAAAPALAGDLNVADDIAARGLFLTLASVFLGGVLVSLTPCLYPMIPITLSVIGAHSVGQKPVQGFLRAFVFVLGIAVVYTAIGVITSMLGVSIQIVLQYKAFWLVLALFFGAMGLSMLGLFELQLPPALAARLQGKTVGKGGFAGAFVVGLVTGVAASPCGSPVLASLAVYAAEQSQKGAIAGSILMFFVYALGIGTLFMVLGAFPSFIKTMPRSGGWMEDVKKFLGAILIGVALYYLSFAFPRNWMLLYWILVIATLLAGAVIVAARSGYRRKYPLLHRAWQVTALALAVAAVWTGFTRLPATLKASAPRQAAGQPAQLVEPNVMMAEAKELAGNDALYGQRARTVGQSETANAETGSAEAVAQSPPSGEPAATGHSGWLASEAEGLALAKKLNKPLMIDFGAEWCTYCKQLEKQTFPAPEVAPLLEDFVLVKIDATDLTDEIEALQQKYGASTLPTVAFLTADGEHLKKFDLKKFEKPADFQTRLRQVREAIGKN